jgi:drug/metabolite transporter (DMT)-like permease
MMKNILIWLTLCLIWGSTWIFIKIGLIDGLPPLAFASARFLLAIVIVGVILSVKAIPLPKTRAEWSLIALTGFLQFSLNYSTVFWAEQYITSGLAAVLQSTITVFGLLLAWIFLPDERITKLKIIAVATGITGVAIIFYDQLSVQSVMAFAGCVAVVAGSYCAAQASILIKSRGGKIDPATLLFGQMVCGMPAILIYTLVVEGNPLNHNWSARAIACVLYLAIAGTVAAFWLYYYLLNRVESTKAMMISLATPLLAVVIGAIVLGETLPPQTGVGGALIIGAVGLIVFRKKRASEIVEGDADEAVVIKST